SGGGYSSIPAPPSSISRWPTTRATSRASSRRRAPPSAIPCASGSENRGEAAQVGAALQPLHPLPHHRHARGRQGDGRALLELLAQRGGAQRIGGMPRHLPRPDLEGLPVGEAH